MNTYQLADRRHHHLMHGTYHLRHRLIARQSVAPAGDCLFGGMHSQTYRWID